MTRLTHAAREKIAANAARVRDRDARRLGFLAHMSEESDMARELQKLARSARRDADAARRMFR